MVETLTLTAEYVLSLTLIKWGVSRWMDYQKQLQQDLEVLNHPIAVSMPIDLSSVMMRIDDRHICLVNIHATNMVQAPVYDGEHEQGFAHLSVGEVMERRGLYRMVDPRGCPALGDMLREVYREMVDQKRIHFDSYATAQPSIDRLGDHEGLDDDFIFGNR